MMMCVGLLGFIIVFILFRVLAKLQTFHFHSSQIATIIERQERIIMTVQEVKDRIAGAKTAIQTAVTTEIAEVKALIHGQTGATPAQLDELGAGVTDLQTSAIAAVGSVSDNISGAPGPGPVPQP